jgi:hypothetical protein
MPSEVRAKATEMWTHFACICLDGLFLCLWAVLNYCVNIAITHLRPDGVDVAICFVLQSLFGVATLAPIAIFIYRDIRIMWIRVREKIANSVTT